MPVYLVHGFRWPREGFTGIRVHAVLNGMDEISVEYIQNGKSRRDLLRSLRKKFPEIMKELDHSDPEVEAYVQPGCAGSNAGGSISGGSSGRRLEFIEQYNPEDVDGPYAVSQPYAYVGDKVVVFAASPATDNVNGASKSSTTTRQGQDPIQVAGNPAAPPARSTTSHSLSTSKVQPFADIAALSVNVEDVIANGPGLTNKAWEALADLRDKIAVGEKIGWWVVYNGDPEREYDELSDEDDGYDEEEDEEMEDVEEGEEYDAEEVAGPGVGRLIVPGPGSAMSQQQRGHRPTKSDNAPIPTSSMTGTTYPTAAYPNVQHHRQASSSGLTALPVRPLPPTTLPAPVPSRSRPNTAPPPQEPSKGGKQKDREKDVPEDPAKLKEVNKSQGLRRKFFGRKT